MHIPVLLKEVLEGLEIQEGDTVVDATLGGGGLPRKICELYGSAVKIIGLDVDEDAVKRSKVIMDGSGCDNVFVVANFRDIKKVLDEVGHSHVERIVFDLGLSSFQIDSSGRGFSFLKNEPLEMTFGRNISVLDVTAEEVVNKWSEDVIRSIISSYGEERYAGRISKGIVEARKRSPILTTFDLVKVIEDSVPEGYRRGRIHPATKTFQALRIAVNDEMSALEEGLEGAFERLSPGGRIAVITFHSLEDRIVKRFFIEKEKEMKAERVNKKPIRPTRDEMKNNRRSRSAKLRIIKKK